MPEQNQLRAIYLRPINLVSEDLPNILKGDEHARDRELLDFLVTPGVDASSDEMLRRYREISTGPTQILYAPNDEHILEKTIWPLRHAKSSFMLGNPLGTISLCGTSAEMFAIMMFEMSDFTIGDQPMTTTQQSRIFGRTFEKLGQDRRVEVLRAYGLVDERTQGCFSTIREIRNRYLHLWSVSHDKISTDAVRCFNAATDIAKFVIGQEVRDGILHLHEKFARYVDRMTKRLDADE